MDRVCRLSMAVHHKSDLENVLNLDGSIVQEVRLKMETCHISVHHILCFYWGKEEKLLNISCLWLVFRYYYYLKAWLGFHILISCCTVSALGFLLFSLQQPSVCANAFQLCFLTHVWGSRGLEGALQEAGPEVRQGLIQVEGGAPVVLSQVSEEDPEETRVLRVQGAQRRQHLLEGAFGAAVQLGEVGWGRVGTEGQDGRCLEENERKNCWESNLRE